MSHLHRAGHALSARGPDPRRGGRDRVLRSRPGPADGGDPGVCRPRERAGSARPGKSARNLVPDPGAEPGRSRPRDGGRRRPLVGAELALASIAAGRHPFAASLETPGAAGARSGCRLRPGPFSGLFLVARSEDPVLRREFRYLKMGVAPPDDRGIDRPEALHGQR